MQSEIKTLNNPSSVGLYVSNLLRALHLAFVYLPWIWFLLLGICVGIAVLQVGHWPYMGHPDPSTGSLSLLELFHLPAYFAMFLVLVSLPIELCLLVLGLIVPKIWRGFAQYIKWHDVGIYALGYGLFYLVMWKDVLNLMAWFVD